MSTRVPLPWPKTSLRSFCCIKRARLQCNVEWIGSLFTDLGGYIYWLQTVLKTRSIPTQTLHTPRTWDCGLLPTPQGRAWVFAALHHAGAGVVFGVWTIGWDHPLFNLNTFQVKNPYRIKSKWALPNRLVEWRWCVVFLFIVTCFRICILNNHQCVHLVILP